MQNIVTQPAGFEPARGDPNGFQVHRLNRSATTATHTSTLHSFFQALVLRLAMVSYAHSNSCYL